MEAEARRNQGRHWRRTGTILGAMLGSGLLATTGWGLRGVVAPVQAAPLVATTMAAPAPVRDSYAELVARVAPAVVTIRTERVIKASASGTPFGNDPLLQRFFGERFQGFEPPVQRSGGLGSGVIVSPDGYVLTNHHVIDGAQRITIDLPDRRSFDAKMVGSDPPSDLAVLKIETTGLPSLPLGSSNAVRVGDVVLAFGNPLGVGQTVTMGIISAKGRATGQGDGTYEDFLQTDAPINQGNSGGALVNTQGELIGINSQILSGSGGNIGIGFAIPASMADNVMHQLIQHGSVERGRLGVLVQGVSAELAKSLGLEEVRGALVSSVEKASPAAQAGIEQGDVITTLNGETLRDSNDLRNRIAGTRPGTEIELGVQRDGRPLTLHAKLAKLNATQVAADTHQPTSPEGRYGMSVAPMNESMARQLGVDAQHGVVVTELDPAGAAAEAGLRTGDVIQEVNHQRVDGPDQLEKALERSGERPALVLVTREGNNLFLALAPHA
jgi:serine protease Do